MPSPDVSVVAEEMLEGSAPHKKSQRFWERKTLALSLFGGKRAATHGTGAPDTVCLGSRPIWMIRDRGFPDAFLGAALIESAHEVARTA